MSVTFPSIDTGCVAVRILNVSQTDAKWLLAWREKMSHRRARMLACLVDQLRKVLKPFAILGGSEKPHADLVSTRQVNLGDALLAVVNGVANIVGHHVHRIDGVGNDRDLVGFGETRTDDYVTGERRNRRTDAR